jgi:Xaa-Pro aminopeptidase
MKNRARRLAKWLRKNKFDAGVFLREEIELLNCDYLYFGGAKLSSEYGAIIIDSSGGCTAVAHEYSFERVRGSGEYSRVFEIRQSVKELVAAIRNINHSFPKLAVDLGSISASTLYLLEKNGIKVGETSLREFVFNERSIKSEYEISEMESAIGVARRAFEKTIETLRSGISIDEIARTLNKTMLDEGALGPSFETDIRIRHKLHEAEVGRLSRGDLVLFDFGARLPSMYLSDVGRTIPFGVLDVKTSDFLEKVCSIKKEGLRRIVSGKSGEQVREDIDQIIKEHGFESTHRPGHQIGLNVHEPYGPHLNFGEENSSLKLKTGNVVTWEPGIGLDSKQPRNRFGMAHMEDMILVGSSPRALGDFDLQYWS